MKVFLLCMITFLLASGSCFAQDFITRGKIIYEIKRNNKLMFRSQNLSQEPFALQMPETSVWYRELLFTGNISLYCSERDDKKPVTNAEGNTVYTDLGREKITCARQNANETYVYEDSIQKPKWKILNETRMIAGFTCRKAITRIFDSVYVVAFYCPEIVSNGGPELFSGLPGMILGLAIPRYFTTWFATRLEVANLDESKIVPPTAKKGKVYTKLELIPILTKKYREQGWTDVTDDKVKEMLSAYILN